MKDVEKVLIKAGIPHYWDSIVESYYYIKVVYFDYDTGEEICDIFMLDDNDDIYRKLDHMPFDKNGRHATGWEVWNQTTSGGFWEDVYEDKED